MKLNNHKFTGHVDMHPRFGVVMLLPSTSPSYLKSPSDQVKSPMLGKKETSLLFLKRGDKKTQRTAAWGISLLYLGRS